ncbi:MAG: hypothetical protein AAF415_17265 [Pseudomonadota bacterium]
MASHWFSDDRRTLAAAHARTVLAHHSAPFAQLTLQDMVELIWMLDRAGFGSIVLVEYSWILDGHRESRVPKASSP